MDHIFLFSQGFGAKCRNKFLGDLSVNFWVFLSSNTRFIFTNLLEIALSKNLPVLNRASIYGYMRRPYQLTLDVRIGEYLPFAAFGVIKASSFGATRTTSPI